MRAFLFCRYSTRAFGYAVPIGGLAGLIGLGGGEFRLPVLVHAIGFPARAAIPINLLVSLATLAFAFLVRAQTLRLDGLQAHLPEILALAAGGVASVRFGAALVARLSDRRLEGFIAALLLLLGLGLMGEAFLPAAGGGLAPADPLGRVGIALAAGAAVGIVSSLLGVAGGELLIPALMFLFGADIRVAGNASLIISLAVVSVGLWQLHRAGAFPAGRGPVRIAAAMSMGSVIGALVGGLAVAFAPVVALKLILGGVLVAAGIRTMAVHRPH